MTERDIDKSLGRVVAGSTAWIFLEQWSSKLVSLLMFAILARLLTPADFGLVALATTFVAFLQTFVDSGFSKALIQKRSLSDKDASTAFWTSLLISLVLYGALVLTSPLLADLMNEPRLTNVLVALGATLPLSALSRTPAALLTRDFSFKNLSLRTMAGSLVGAVVALPLAILGFGVWALVAQTVAQTLAAVVVLWAATEWRPGFAYSLDSLKSLWRAGISLLGIELLDTLQTQIDKFVVGAVFSVEELGIYSLAQRLGVMLQEIITTVIARVSLPTFSRIQDDLPRVRRIFRQLSFTTASVSFPVFAIVAALAAQIIPFVFGEGWHAAIPLVWIMAGGWAFASVATFDRGALVGTGHAGAAFWLAMVQNAISIALVFAFIPLGITGIALSRFARLVTWPIRLVALKKCVGLPIWSYVWQVLRCALATAPVVLIIAILQTTSWANANHAFWWFALPAGVVGCSLTFWLNWVISSEESREPLRKQISALRNKILRRRRRA